MSGGEERRRLARWIRYLPLCLALSACASLLGGREQRPNVVLILVDDLGVECLSTYGGSSYETPHIDALAASGTRFEYAFCTPVCTPSRVQLLTGQYPFRTGWDEGEWKRPIEARTLDPGLPSLARMLREDGYATAVAGKWQLARFHREPDHPRALGFDEHCLWTYHLDDEGPVDPRFWKPSIWENGRLRTDVQRDDVFGPDVFSDFLIDFIERHRDEPFFAFYPTALVHRPYTVTPATIEDPNVPVEETEEKRKDSLARFGANVAYLDHLIGRLVDALERNGLRERTLILLTADNGTDYRIVSRVGTREVKGGKTRMDDRGASVPLFASWPGVVPAGGVCGDLVDFTDFFPTLADVCGAPLPRNTKLDGRTFEPQLRGRRVRSRPWVYVQLEGKWFLRSRGWRLHDDGSLYDVRDRFDGRLVEDRDRTPSSEQARRFLTTAAGVLLTSPGS